MFEILKCDLLFYYNFISSIFFSLNFDQFQTKWIRNEEAMAILVEWNLLNKSPIHYIHCFAILLIPNVRSRQTNAGNSDFKLGCKSRQSRESACNLKLTDTLYVRKYLALIHRTSKHQIVLTRSVRVLKNLRTKRNDLKQILKCLQITYFISTGHLLLLA